MKRFIHVFVSFGMIASLLLSCGEDEPGPQVEEVTACFSVPTNVREEIEVTFDASCSKNAESFEWDFGDGATSNEATPTHAYEVKGDYKVLLKVTGKDNKTDTIAETITVTNTPIVYHTSLVPATTDEVWADTAIHVIMGEFEINTTITIVPGTIVKFHNWASSLRIGENGTLLAMGTADKPITFKASASQVTEYNDYWEAIYFVNGTDNSVLKYCEIESGGNSSGSGMVYISGCEVSIDNCKLSNANSYVIRMEADGKFKSFNNNELSTANEYTEIMYLEPNNVHTIGQNNDFITDKGILVGYSPLTEPSVTWQKQNCRYITSDFTIGSETGSVLTIAKGVELELNGIISVGGTNLQGGLVAVGTASDSISLKGNSINFRTGTLPSTELRYCTFSGAGSSSGWYSSSGMLQLSDAHVTIENCNFKNTSCAVLLKPGGYFDSFNNNVINSSNIGVEVDANWVHTLGLNNEINCPIEIAVASSGAFTQTEVTWPKQQYPYLIRDKMLIGSTEGSTLIIAPGTTLELLNKISVGGEMYMDPAGYNGRLIADGDVDSIRFTSPFAVKSKGDCEAVYFGANTMEGTVVNKCILEYGGEDNRGSLATSSSIPVFTNNTIRYSSWDGIYMGSSSTPTLSGNVYIDVAGMHERYMDSP